jgi:hypothetical protein
LYVHTRTYPYKKDYFGGDLILREYIQERTTFASNGLAHQPAYTIPAHGVIAPA